MTWKSKNDYYHKVDERSDNNYGHNDHIHNNSDHKSNNIMMSA